jgi:hypothetical protein
MRDFADMEGGTERGWEEVLERLVEAARAFDDPNERFRAAGLERRSGPQVYHRGFHKAGEERGWIKVPKRDLDELRERKLIRVETRSNRVPAGKQTVTVKQWHFDITDAGFQHVDNAARSRSGARTTNGDVLRETWSWRELPILRIALREFDAGKPLVDLEEIRAELGLTGDDIWAGAHALRNSTPPYLEMSLSGGWSDNHAGGSIDAIHERARRELGTWPTAENLVSEIATALRQAADEAPQPDDKSRLRAAADALAGFARDVAVSVAARHLGA